MNLTEGFESFMAAAYPEGIPRDSVQWRESRRVFMAGVHFAACALKNCPDAKTQAIVLSKATSAFADSILPEYQS